MFGLCSSSCVDFIVFFILSQYCISASSTSIFLLCVIIRFFFFKTRSSISASCCWVCMSKHRAWAAVICDVLVNDGVRAASTTDGGNSFSFGAVSVPVVVASKSVSSSSRSISIHLKPDKVNEMLCTDTQCCSEISN